jgi:hypothetical protein
MSNESSESQSNVSAPNQYDPKLANELLSHIWKFTEMGWTIELKPPQGFRGQRRGFVVILRPPASDEKVSPREAVQALASRGVLGGYPIFQQIHFYNLYDLVKFLRGIRVMFIRDIKGGGPARSST